MKATGPEYGAAYTLIGPDGTTAVFNNEASGSFVGILDPAESSGLDSAEVREDLATRAEADGAIQGNNYYGARPVVLAGIIRANTAIQRGERMALLQQASNAMRADATLKWTPEGGVAVMLLVRRQQPLRITGPWVKKFQLALVSDDPRIYSEAEHTLTKAKEVLGEPENVGNTEAPAIIELVGPQTNPEIKNETTGTKMKFTYALASGHTLKIDTLNHTVYDGTTNVYNAWNFTESTWTNLGANGKTKLKCMTGEMKISWHDAWV